MKKGFTLIELLIVVAIIGILAAIAVPNFLNAQIRAKVSRCWSDMKALDTAVRMCLMDTNHLPIDGWDDDTPEGRKILKEVFNGVGDFPESDRKTSHYLAVLTSPIAYMSSVPIDPFIAKNSLETERGFGSPFDTYIYADQDPRIPGDDQGIQALSSPVAEQFGIRPLKDNEWAFIGLGPDGVAGIGTGTGAYSTRGFPYSSSNGLVSRGDVVMTSGGIIGQ
ncbi:MAG TPA: prepilin-type N-terminal cleavage/methylation domain-containing protein [bacterium]|nr:prepilin-type N-terminal cleavage/methylation domain-containing protein [Candidatus Omnitrophota bacterium]HOJ58775.1 prepilin-type N-terminal cleavage/methylation domain-containing protein [bacterium]HOL93947.1 prepilin-type N-terminal cleavage/methylation domain-containing protein [bacterium]HPO99217.1 prepilin-type N-terminal cleavage/methylation domain-containing protein [bacterium]HXK95049.1 prepilin-type N-terminal cleavage/methylation domain-containing protein [bacterium]